MPGERNGHIQEASPVAHSHMAKVDTLSKREEGKEEGRKGERQTPLLGQKHSCYICTCSVAVHACVVVHSCAYDRLDRCVGARDQHHPSSSISFHFNFELGSLIEPEVYCWLIISRNIPIHVFQYWFFKGAPWHFTSALVPGACMTSSLY